MIFPFVDHQRMGMIIGICTSKNYQRRQESNNGKDKQYRNTKLKKTAIFTYKWIIFQSFCASIMIPNTSVNSLYYLKCLSQ